MAVRTPTVWCADLLAPVDPRAAQDQATHESADFAVINEIWSAQEGTLRLAGAANEVLTFQLVVEKRAGRIESIRAENAGEIAMALYQHVAVPVDGVFYDDALVPVEAGDCGEAVAAIARKGPRFAGRRRQAFTVELYVPKGASPGQRRMALLVATSRGQVRLDVELTVHNFELPDENACTADINNYSRSPATGFDLPKDDLDGYLAIERGYFRMAREHRAMFHLLPYGQSGRQEKGFAPILTGRGRDRRVADWTDFDRHWGPYLDGSAYAGTRGGPQPIEYLYTPVNLNWPAYFEKFGTPGYTFEFKKVLGEMAEHFAQRGWTRTRFEVFFNHKARWKYFPWDMDEIRFERDNEATIELARMAADVAREHPAVRIINRIDSSWIFDKSALTEMADLVNLWVVNRNSHSHAPDAVSHLRGKGQEVWFYGGAGPIAAADRVDSLRWAWIAWGRQTDGFCWWNGLSWGRWDAAGGGTGHCFYPGRRFGIAGPLASIRLKVLHRAMQDHAYLTLLTNRRGRGAADEAVARTIGAGDREGWYQRGEGSEGGGADIQAGSRTEKPWNTAPRAAWSAARGEVARAIESGSA